MIVLSLVCLHLHPYLHTYIHGYLLPLTPPRTLITAQLNPSPLQNPPLQPKPKKSKRAKASQDCPSARIIPLVSLLLSSPPSQHHLERRKRQATARPVHSRTSPQPAKPRSQWPPGPCPVIRWPEPSIISPVQSSQA